jgi:dolichol-phosphate mannosyltransferase
VTAPDARPDECELSIILPSYTEAENLRVLLPRLTPVLDELTGSWEVLVVDTVEPLDDTAALCDGERVRYTPRVGGNDYGDAIRTGIRESRGRMAAIMDVDGSHDPEFLRQMWSAREQADIVIASRYTAGGSTDNPPLLVMFSRMLNSVFAVVLRMPVRDISNSLRLYRGAPLRALELRFAHFDIQEEILARLLWDPVSPATVLELPFRFRRRLSGDSKRSMAVFIAAFVSAMFRLARLRSTLRRAARAA